MAYEIIHHGGYAGVTGSCHQLRIDPANSILVDCGLFQGAETAADGRAESAALEVRFPVEDIRALILTHVHIDHVGRLPWLLAAGYKGPIYCSEASARLLPTVLADAFALGVSRHAQHVERYLQLVESRLRPLPWKQWADLPLHRTARCRIRLQRAGHILGSAYVECDAHAPGAASHRVVFSGDLGAPWTPLLPAPRPPLRADCVVLESTYGDRTHDARRTRRQRLQAAIEHALQDGGTVIVPAFSIGRTQELLYELEDILHRQARAPGPHAERWAQLRIYLDSPLASRFTALYRELQPHWDAEAHARLRAGRQPLNFAQLVAVDEHDAHLANVRRLAASATPAIVIAASGMCAGGRVVAYLKAMLPDPRHDVLFVGYQAPGTPGADIQRHGPRGGFVMLDGQRIPIRAAIHTLSGYSGHADQADLVRFVAGMRQRPAEVRLVHGEAHARSALARALASACAGAVRIHS
jgi:metallo-beta-lactamase family protein